MMTNAGRDQTVRHWRQIRLAESLQGSGFSLAPNVPARELYCHKSLSSY
jgi:hypothetical protein